MRPRPGTSVGSASAILRPRSESIGSFRRSSSRVPMLSRRCGRISAQRLALSDHVDAVVEARVRDLLHVLVEALEVVRASRPSCRRRGTRRAGPRSSSPARAPGAQRRPSTRARRRRKISSRSSSSAPARGGRLAHALAVELGCRRRRHAAPPPAPSRPPPPRSMPYTCTSAGVCERTSEVTSVRRKRALAGLRRAHDGEVPGGAGEVEHERLGALLGGTSSRPTGAGSPAPSTPWRSQNGSTAATAPSATPRSSGGTQTWCTLAAWPRALQPSISTSRSVGRASRRGSPAPPAAISPGAPACERRTPVTGRALELGRAHVPRWTSATLEALVDRRVDLEVAAARDRRQQVGVGRAEHDLRSRRR